MALAAVSLDALPPELVWRADRIAHSTTPVEPTGFAALDAELPGGGWPRGAVIELLADTPGIGEVELLLPLLRRADSARLIAWIAPPWQPYAPGLAARGLRLEQLLIVQPASAAATLWAVRQALASNACHAVLAWMTRIDMAALRRLQLAAESSGTPLFLFRPGSAARQPSPASLRLQLSGDTAGLRIDLLKRRGPTAGAPLRLAFARLHDASRHAVDRPVLPRPAPAGLHTRRG